MDRQQGPAKPGDRTQRHPVSGFWFKEERPEFCLAGHDCRIFSGLFVMHVPAANRSRCGEVPMDIQVLFACVISPARVRTIIHIYCLIFPILGDMSG